MAEWPGQHFIVGGCQRFGSAFFSALILPVPHAFDHSANLLGAEAVETLAAF
jgi:hypothetical protein